MNGSNETGKNEDRPKAIEPDSRNCDDEFITLKEAAKRLHYSYDYMFELVKQGAIPHYQRGYKHRILLSWEEVKEWMGWWKNQVSSRNRPKVKIIPGKSGRVA